MGKFSKFRMIDERKYEGFHSTHNEQWSVFIRKSESIKRKCEVIYVSKLVWISVNNNNDAITSQIEVS